MNVGIHPFPRAFDPVREYVPIVFARKFGALPDKGVDQTSELQRALIHTELFGGVVRLEPGDYIHRGLTIKTGGVEIKGKGHRTRLLCSSPAAHTIDIGDGTLPLRGVHIRDVRIWSTVTKTGGSAIRFRKITNGTIDGVYAGSFDDSEADGNRLYDGFIFAEYALCAVKGSLVVGCSNKGATIYGNALQNFGAEIFFDAATTISGCGSHNIHVAGGSGGVKLDCNTQLSTGGDGLLVDGTLGGAPNREIFLGPNFSADGNAAGTGVHIAPNSLSFLLATGAWSGGNGFGFVIEGGQPTGASFRWTGGLIFANLFTGVVWSGGDLTLSDVDIHFNGANDAAGAQFGVNLLNTDAGYHANVIGNKITGNGNVANGGYGVSIAAGCPSYDVSHNHTFNNQSGSINAPGGHDATRRAVGNTGYAFGDKAFLASTADEPQDIASAATTLIGSAQSRSVRITGTTTITGFGTAPAGIVRRGTFAGALTLTHSAALLLPASRNITTAANDRFEALSLGAGNWTVLWYERASAGQIPGTATNDNAAAGNIGEVVSSTVLAGAAVALTTDVAADVTSIALTAGDWDVWGNVWFGPAATTNITRARSWVSDVSATTPTAPNEGAFTAQHFGSAGLVTGGGNFSQNAGVRRISLAAPATIYLSALGTFTADVLAAYGHITARRAR